MPSSYKAVVFDFGGVLMSYDDSVAEWKEWETTFGLPCGSIQKTLFSVLTDVPGIDRMLFEGRVTGEDLEDDFLPTFFSHRLGVSFPRPFPVLSKWQGSGAKIRYNDEMLRVVKRLRQLGYYTVILTNNFKIDRAGKLERTRIDRDLFDFIVESTVEGVMKPNLDIYKITQSRLPHHITPEQCIFLDDIRVNCSAAETFGWKSILVDVKDTSKSVDKLESLLGMQLR